ncbi:MAG: hypothetical protein KGL39_51375 [Patescibacteria group bacterium]|nr:hypothetical protein [Patescibacteria group bacterium]
MASKKTLFHSELCKRGVTKVMVESDVLESQYPDKPPYVILKVDGEERYYNCENDSCAAFFEGQKGRIFSISAAGKKDEATLSYVGEPASNLPPKPASQRPPSHPPKQEQNRKRVPMGQSVGMALNNACHNLTARGKELDLAEIYNIASDILRLSYYMEDGNLAQPHSVRNKVTKIKNQAGETQTIVHRDKFKQCPACGVFMDETQVCKNPDCEANPNNKPPEGGDVPF